MAELPHVFGGSRLDSGSQGLSDRHAIIIACQFSPVAHLRDEDIIIVYLKQRKYRFFHNFV